MMCFPELSDSSLSIINSPTCKYGYWYECLIRISKFSNTFLSYLSLYTQFFLFSERCRTCLLRFLDIEPEIPIVSEIEKLNVLQRILG
jgi:hypothetical protein